MNLVHSRSAREHRDTEKIGGSNLTSNPQSIHKVIE